MSGFDRITPPEERLLERRGGLDEADPAGRAALFSGGQGSQRTSPARGPLGLAVGCSRCGATTPLDAAAALRAAFPLFLVAPWRRHAVFAVCPACRRRAWLRLAARDAAPGP